VNVTTKKSSKAGSAKGSRSKQPRILVFGDSHSHAIQRAIHKRIGKGQSSPVSAYRLRKEKNGSHIGDTSFEAFLEMIADLGEQDVVVSTIGGNQHAVFSTIQHPRPFDFFTPESPASADTGLEIVPYRALSELFTRGIQKGDGKSLEAIRNATAARVVHIIPPPPKADGEFIQKYHETLFANEGIASRGVSPAALRLKFWQLQTRVLKRLCKKLGIDVLMPPGRVLESGFLRPEFYAQDATHANWRYGERLLRIIETRYGNPGAGTANE
jgi:hypothetical protein